MKLNQISVISFICAIYGVFIVIEVTATSGLQSISDDDLVERMKSNEFVIALFCKLF